ncbi:hypothetical protein [Levilactobacillus brevis]|uniref:hypothetical protein n=1 Tax=Levilactobacillus brevis TaxID=1580 RepID=UPI00339BFCBA
MKVRKLRLFFLIVASALLMNLFIVGNHGITAKANVGDPKFVKVGSEKYNYDPSAGAKLDRYFSNEGYQFGGLVEKGKNSLLLLSQGNKKVKYKYRIQQQVGTPSATVQLDVQENGKKIGTQTFYFGKLQV